MRLIGSGARPWAGSLVAGSAAVLLLPLSAAADCERPQSTAGPGKVELVLDASGSMAEPDESGTAKIEAAKQGLRTVVDELPAAAHVGLRVYGATDLAESDPRACEDSNLVVPVGKADKPALRQAIDDYRPVGWTPIAYALEQAAQDLGSSGQRSIVLVSDGEETCDRDPAAVARRLRAKGIDLRIDVVGFDVSGDTKRQLERIADAGGGVYYHATNAEELADVLGQSTLRPFRPFLVHGTPVEGSPIPHDAPEMAPGQYTDFLGGQADVDGSKYYAIPRTARSSVHVGYTAWPPSHGGSRGISDGAELTLGTPGGEHCASETALQVDSATRSLLADGVTFQPGAGTDECDRADRLILQIRRTQAPDHGRVPFEFVVVVEPPVASQAGLPEPFDGSLSDDRSVRRSRPERKVAAGGSFSDAASLAPGTWTDSLQPGEVLFYRVRADWGQTPAVSVRFGPDREVADALTGFVFTTVTAYGPMRQPLGNEVRTVHGSFIGDEVEQANLELPPVRYRNRESFGPARGASMAGNVYFAVAMADVDGCPFQLPMRISVTLDGQPSGRPDYVAAPVEPEAEPPEADDRDETEPEPEAEASTSENNNALVAAVGVTGGGVVMLAVALMLRLRARARRGPLAR